MLESIPKESPLKEEIHLIYFKSKKNNKNIQKVVKKIVSKSTIPTVCGIGTAMVGAVVYNIGNSPANCFIGGALPICGGIIILIGTISIIFYECIKYAKSN